jgi:hypothetical protein
MGRRNGSLVDGGAHDLRAPAFNSDLDIAFVSRPLAFNGVRRRSRVGFERAGRLLGCDGDGEHDADAHADDDERKSNRNQ